MEGCERRERRRMGHALAAGWYGENFSRAGKHLKDLGFYLRALEPEKPKTPQQLADEAAALFEGLAQRGLVTIREVKKDDRCPDNP